MSLLADLASGPLGSVGVPTPLREGNTACKKEILQVHSDLDA